MNATMIACGRCGTVVPESALALQGDGSRICMGCQAAHEGQNALRKSVLNTGLGAPGLAMLGVIMFCIPLANMIAPALFALAGGWQGISAIRLFVELNNRRDDHGVDGGLRAVLLGGVVAVTIALGVLGIQVLGWVGMALS